MAITTRDYKISSTSTINNVSGSSIGMPDGMTSSISSDGTTFLLNGDDSQISAIGSGTIIMTANGTDEMGNERNASASVPGEIIQNFCSITVELNNLSSYLSEITNGNFYMKEIAFCSFSFTGYTGHYNVFYIISSYSDEANNEFILDDTSSSSNGFGFLYIPDTQNNLYHNGSFESSGTDNYGSGNNDTKTGTSNEGNSLRITGARAGYDENMPHNGQVYFTFVSLPTTSSFALKMN